MGILDLPYVMFALWITDTREVIPLRLNRDDDFLKHQNEVLVDFWENNVLKGIPPQRTVKDFSVCTTTKTSTIQADKRIVSVCDILKDINSKKATLEEIKDQHETEIKEYMKAAGVLLNGDVPLATWLTPKTNTKFDEHDFKADHPELYETYLKEFVPNRRFSLKQERKSDE
jgi:predicted phage-related endonuclease